MTSFCVASAPPSVGDFGFGSLGSFVPPSVSKSSIIPSSNEFKPTFCGIEYSLAVSTKSFDVLKLLPYVESKFS